MSTTKTRTVRVVQIMGEEACIAAPRVLPARVGDEVTFKNLTGKAVTIVFEDPNLFGRPDLPLGPGKEETLTVQNVAAGAYPYTVSCAATVAKAAGPIIIIYPREPVTP